MANIENGNNTPGLANVDSNFNLQVVGPGRTAAGVPRGGGEAAGSAAIIFSENDPGTATGARSVLSPETDDDYRLRVALDTLVDTEVFSYGAQNTGKYTVSAITMVPGYSTAGFSLNSTNIVTTTTGVRARTYAEFPVTGVIASYYEAKLSVSAAGVPTNVVVDVGAFRDSGTNPFTPTDGAFFRATPAGWFGVAVASGGPDNTVGPFAFVPVANRVYKLGLYITVKEVEFWIDDVLYGRLPRPADSGQPFTSTSLPWACRQVITGGPAASPFQAIVRQYTVSLGGPSLSSTPDEQGARCYGSHQGLGGGTMGSLATYANSTTPAGVAGSNTGAAATGLGGQVNLNAPAAAVTDLILISQQVPAGAPTVQGRRLALRGVSISAAILGAAVATTETSLAFSLAFGHTAVSLAVTESATAKAPRREALGILSWPIGAAVGSGPREGRIYTPFTTAIYVNPGEFIAVVGKVLAGTATPSQTIYIHVTYDYGWI